MTTGYRVSLRGRVPDTVLRPYIDEFSITRTEVRTTLAGSIVDRSHLDGLLAYLNNAGLEILEVTATE